MRKQCSTTSHHSSWLRAGTRLYGYVLLLLGLFAAALPAQAQTQKRIYTIGNSVTDGVNFQGFKALAESRGYVHTFGRQMIPGAPLSWLWQHPNDGFTEQPFGYPTNAFPNYTWDAISLQPFDRHIEGSDGDRQMARNYIDLAKGNSPDVQVYIYSKYPSKKDGVAETAANWNTVWLAAYTGGWDGTNDRRDYFERLTTAVRADYAGTDLKQPLMIPVGQAMHALNIKMAAGEVPGYSSIWQVYSDGIHVNNVGSYIIACTFFSTIYKESPVGLPVPTQYGTISNTMRDIIQQTVWETVSGLSSWTGVNAETISVTGISVSPATQTLALNQTAQLTASVAPANATNKRVSWTTSNSAVASVSTAGVVTGVSAGSATITATSQDGGFTAGSAVTVTADAVPVESVSISPAGDIRVNTGNTVKLTAAVLPAFATNKNVTWSTNAGDVVAVDQTGNVTGLKPGYATVFARTEEGNKEAVSQIEVTPNSKPVAVLSATPTTGFAPLAVRFDARNSTDPNPGDFILGFEWDFGDGSPLANSNAPSHTYAAAGTYTVTLRVMDNHDVYSDPVTATITVSTIDPNNSVVIEYWMNVGGSNTDAIPLNTPPTRTEILSSLEIATNAADDFGARIRGMLKPTVSGAYTFYIASDDYSKLFLSTDATSANKALIASVSDWTNSREWTKYASQKSAVINLVGGQEYYFEVLHKEGNGGDNLAVGWTGPGTSAISVIGSPHIRQYVPGTTPTGPAAPTGLAASNISQTGFTLNWTASAGSVASYNVYTGATLAGNTTSTSFAVTGLTAATDYAVTVRAVGGDGTLSAASTALAVRTAGAAEPSAGARSLDLSFTNAADADRFAFIFDTGGEVVKTVENGVMKLVLNKKEWHFFQVYIHPFDFINNPYVSFRIKVDQATPVKMWIKQGEGDANQKQLFNQTLQPSADFQTINIHVTDLAPLAGNMSEVGIDIGDYQVPPATFAGTVYIDHFRLGEAARPGTTPPPVETDVEAPTAPANLISSAVATSSFTLSWAASTDNVGVSAYKVYSNDALLATTTNLTAPITGLSPQTAYGMKVVAEDVAGNKTPSEVLMVTTLAPAPLNITREVWSNLSGRGIASIPVNATPTSTTVVTSLQGPTDAGDNYGARIRAIITLAVSGYYTFYMAGDDLAELWLSVNDSPAQATKIAEVTKAVKPNEWTKNRGQKSTEKRLIAGTRYYVEVLHRETNGRDHVAVGWTGPGVRNITVIGGSVLSPFGMDTPPQVASEGPAMYNSATAARQAAAGTAKAGPDNAESNGELLVYPNPVTGGKLTIQFVARERGKATVTLVSALGQSALNQEAAVEAGQNKIEVSTSALPGGLYMLTLKQGSHRIVRKVLIN